MYHIRFSVGQSFRYTFVSIWWHCLFNCLT
uniref:Uncharacterized protein n=1 Tax=Anguilla anguilla TaxID=7936 RepID=A0A0E9TWG1_ANGAN